jgi:sugar phosphate isomerase/epimerase
MPPAPLARRSFLCLAAGAALAPLLNAADLKPSTPAAEALGWRLGVQMFSYRRFPLFDALDHLAALGVRHLEPRTGLKVDARRPDLKFSEDLPADVRKEFQSRLADRGLSMTSCFLDFTADDPAQPRRVFDFCKELGAATVVAEPPAELLDALEKLCDEYQMNLAIHNHQEGQSRYWSPDLLLAACRDRGHRIGGCCDLGQWARSALDPVDCLRKVEGRILAIHLKDVAKKGDRNARNVVFGTGEATLPAALRELRRQRYKGLTTIDYEQDSPAIDDDMARNAAFVEDVARDLR